MVTSQDFCAVTAMTSSQRHVSPFIRFLLPFIIITMVMADTKPPPAPLDEDMRRSPSMFFAVVYLDLFTYCHRIFYLLCTTVLFSLPFYVSFQSSTHLHSTTISTTTHHGCFFLSKFRLLSTLTHQRLMGRDRCQREREGGMGN